jgi:hypothetical protein
MCIPANDFSGKLILTGPSGLFYRPARRKNAKNMEIEL